MDEKTILVIDADEQIQQQIQESLADKPCRFVFVNETSEAIVQFATEMPAAFKMSEIIESHFALLIILILKLH